MPSDAPDESVRPPQEVSQTGDSGSESLSADVLAFLRDRESVATSDPKEDTRRLESAGVLPKVELTDRGATGPDSATTPQSRSDGPANPGDPQQVVSDAEAEAFRKSVNKEPDPAVTALETRFADGGHQMTPELVQGYRDALKANEGPGQTEAQRRTAMDLRLSLARGMADTGKFADATNELTAAISKYPEMAKWRATKNVAIEANSLQDDTFRETLNKAEVEDRAKSPKDIFDPLLLPGEKGPIERHIERHSQNKPESVQGALQPLQNAERDVAGRLTPDGYKTFKDFIARQEAAYPRSGLNRAAAQAAISEALQDRMQQGDHASARELLQKLAEGYTGGVNNANVLESAARTNAVQNKDFMDAFKRNHGNMTRLQEASRRLKR